MIYNGQFQKKYHTHPMEGHRKFLGEGVLKVKIFEAMFVAVGWKNSYYIWDPSGIFSTILTSEDIDDVISRFFAVVCANSW